MDSAKTQLVDRLKTANTVLVTVSSSPSVDQLAACIGLTLIVNKLNKHGSAVYSGDTPSTIEFLKPEDTIEKNTDSLRDFIIALDKNKADKLRYKVEDDMVRIFITPYRTSLGEDDLEFSQGDFNVELIIALGVQKQEELDQAITAHGRILHDATVASVNTVNQSSLGSISWVDPQASSLCELVSDLARSLGDNLLDEQIATALMTGIVAETNRFSNEKTTSRTMSVSAELMNAGANQQLVASKLSEPGGGESTGSVGSGSSDDDNKDDPSGTLNIKHDHDDEEEKSNTEEDAKLPAPSDMPPEGETPPPADAKPDVEIIKDDRTPLDNSNNLDDIINNATSEPDHLSQGAKIVADPPQLGGVLTANSQLQDYEPSTDPLSNITAPSDSAGLPDTHTQIEPLAPETTAEPATPSVPPVDTTSMTPPPPSWIPPFEDKQLETKVDSTLAEPQSTIESIEESVDSPHLQSEPANVDDARDQVQAVLASADNTYKPEPTKSLNAMPLGGPLHGGLPDLSVLPTSSTPQSDPIPNNLGLNSVIPASPSPEEETPPADQVAPPVPPPVTLPIIGSQPPAE
jgi:hypothetical protein